MFSKFEKKTFNYFVRLVETKRLVWNIIDLARIKTKASYSFKDHVTDEAISQLLW